MNGRHRTLVGHLPDLIVGRVSVRHRAAFGRGFAGHSPVTVVNERSRLRRTRSAVTERKPAVMDGNQTIQFVVNVLRLAVRHVLIARVFFAGFDQTASRVVFGDGGVAEFVRHACFVVARASATFVLQFARVVVRQGHQLQSG